MMSWGSHKESRLITKEHLVALVLKDLSANLMQCLHKVWLPGHLLVTKN